MEQLLAEADGFCDIPLDGLRLAEQGQPRSFAAGAELIRQGEVGESMYAILRGRVRVERSHPDLTEPLALAQLGPGEVVADGVARRQLAIGHRHRRRRDRDRRAVGELAATTWPEAVLEVATAGVEPVPGEAGVASRRCSPGRARPSGWRSPGSGSTPRSWTSPNVSSVPRQPSLVHLQPIQPEQATASLRVGQPSAANIFVVIRQDG